MTQLYMNQIDEFNNYYIQQVKDEDNPNYYELPKKKKVITI